MEGMMKKYSLLERLLNDEKIYLDRELSFSRICGWLKVPELLMDAFLRKELGVGGEELLATLRDGEPERLKSLYGIDADF